MCASSLEEKRPTFFGADRGEIIHQGLHDIVPYVLEATLVFVARAVEARAKRVFAPPFFVVGPVYQKLRADSKQSETKHKPNIT